MYLPELGDDVQEKTLQLHVDSRRIWNLASVVVHPTMQSLTTLAKVDPVEVPLKKSFTRDVSNIGH